MNPWYILKIEKTDDKDAIRAAYMALLPKHNPEEDPEGFANLRQAYEEALKEADTKAEPAGDDPVSVFFAELGEIYANFPRRINPAIWEEALQNDVCTALDTEEEVDVKILEFISQNHNLPTNVWVVLNNRFRWVERAEELIQRYGPGLINSIVGSVDNKFDLQYDLFDYDPGADIDRFLFLRTSLTEALDNKNKEEADSVLEEIRGLGVRHPVYDKEMARYEALSGNHEKALDIINAVIEKYPVYENEPFAIYIKATVLLSFDDKEKLEEALSTYKKALEIVPDYFFAQLGIANTLIKQEEYDEAEKYLSDVMLVENPSNGYLISYLVHISGLKLKKYEALYAENPTQDTIEKLAQCYLRNNEHDKCIELLLDKEKTGKVCNMLGYGYARKKEYDLAIEYAVESIEKEPKYYAYITLSEIYLAKRQYKMAVENADTGLAAGLPEEGTEIFGKTRLLADKAYAYKELGEYDKALEAVNAAIAINDKMCDLYAGKAEILLDMYDFSEAHNEAGKAMSLAPGWARPYELMLDIFYRADNPEQMEEIFKEVDEMEIKSHGLSFFRGCMAGSVEDYDKCNEILKGLLEEQDLGIWEDRGLQALCRHNLNAENHEAVAQYSLELIDFLKENNFPPEPRAYMYLASAHNELHGPEKELETIIDGLKAMPDSNDLLLEYHFQYDNEESPEVYNTWRRIMEAAPNNPVPYNRMAILYANEDKPKEALDILAQGLAKLPGNINLIGRRAYVYQDIEEYEKSANDCLLVAENPQNQDTWWEKGPMYFEAAWVYWSKLNNAEAAKKYFFLASENDGTNDNWEKGFLADVYERAGEYEKAMAIHDECIEDDPEDECALLSRGELYKEMGEAAKASADFNRLLEVISENEDAGHDSYRYAGTASLAMDNPEKAREYYEKSTEAVKTDGTKGGICFCIHQSWAKYYRYLGDYAKALEKIDLAIGISNSVMNNDLKQEILKAAGM